MVAADTVFMAPDLFVQLVNQSIDGSVHIAVSFLGEQ